MSIAERTVLFRTLESGDHLSRTEFEERYTARPDIKKAELIEGVVYVGSPVRVREHGEPNAHVVGWLVTYCASRPGYRVGDNATVRLDGGNEPQPDVMLVKDPEAGGQARIDDDGYVEGAPELVVEVAASSASYDLHEKMDAYRRGGVREYIVWQIFENRVDWFRLIGEKYEPIPPGSDGIIESNEFPGLRLDVAALLSGDIVALAKQVS